MSRPTLSELRWPMDEDSRQQAHDWATGISNRAIDWTWRGFDAMRENLLSCIDVNAPIEQLERDLTRNHFAEIQSLWARETGGESSIEPQAEYPEMETRAPAPAKPPAYDIAFVWKENRRVALPIEAKVVSAPGVLAAYIGDTEKFAGGIAAPLVGVGAQIAYLLKGGTDDFFTNLSIKLSVLLAAVPEFSARPHRFTLHPRSSAIDLTLHHMAMYCAKSAP